MKNNKKIKNENKTLGDLISWLDDRGFNNAYEAIEFIEDSLGNEVVKKIIHDVETSYKDMLEGCRCGTSSDCNWTMVKVKK